MQWYLEPFKKFASFSGRARRKEYWVFVIGNVIVASILGAVGQAADMMVIPGIFSILIVIPTFAVLVRRLHDVGKGGGFLLICLIPLVGQILLLLQLIKGSDYGDNKYGPDPKQC